MITCSGKINNREKYEQYTNSLVQSLDVAIKAFVFDFDGTLKSPNEPDCIPIDLIKKAVFHGKSVGVVTASGVSVLKGLAKQIVDLTIENDFQTPIYLGIANGAELYVVNKEGMKKLYSFQIDKGDIKKIVNIWKKVMNVIGVGEKDLVYKGLSTFKDFLKRDWSDYVSNDLFLFSKENNGMCFVEALKVTFVMPKNNIFSQSKFVKLIQRELDDVFGSGKYIIDMGDDVFAHVTLKPGKAPKLVALNMIIKDLGLNDNQVAVFGDMPFGNDRGMLIDSKLPFTFTNKYIYKNISSPPFLLPKSKKTPVASVYKTVEYLLSKS